MATLEILEARLSGKARTRTNWLGKRILQVEVEMDRVSGDCRVYNVKRLWRDATASDDCLDFKMVDSV